MRANYIENPIEWEEEFEFFVEVKVRFSETDMYGHLNNTVNIAYFELARIEFFKHIGFTKWSEVNSKHIIVAADIQCDYLKQVFFDEIIRVYVKTAKVGNSSIDLHYLAKNESNEPVFTGRGVIVHIDKETGKAVPWTDEEQLLLLRK